MINLLYFLLGSFAGALVTLFLFAVININRENKELAHARKRIEALEEDKRILKKRLAGKANMEDFKQCAICGVRYDSSLMNCPHCGSTATAAMLDQMDKEATKIRL